VYKRQPNSYPPTAVLHSIRASGLTRVALMSAVHLSDNRVNLQRPPGVSICVALISLHSLYFRY